MFPLVEIDAVVAQSLPAVEVQSFHCQVNDNPFDIASNVAVAMKVGDDGMWSRIQTCGPDENGEPSDR